MRLASPLHFAGVKVPQEWKRRRSAWIALPPMAAENQGPSSSCIALLQEGSPSVLFTLWARCQTAAAWRKARFREPPCP